MEGPSVTTKLIYGTDTGSFEDYGQCVILLIPDDVDDVEEYVAEHNWDDIPQQTVATLEDVEESLMLILAANQIPSEMAADILTSLLDALDNND